MNPNRSVISTAIYYLVAAGSLISGIVLFVLKGFFEKADHIWMEFSAGLVLAGLVAAWCPRDYARSTAIRFFLIVFFAIFAFIHWLDHFRGELTIVSPALNSLPMVALLVAEIQIRQSRKSGE
jgi:predicted membrane channel-forming protein YqfA (hemolysin III family)